MAHSLGIYRVHKPGSASGSWQVQVRSNGKPLNKSFSDRDFGGQDLSLQAAIRHRDSVLAELGMLSKLAKQPNPYPGVSRTEKPRNEGGRTRTDPYWQAYWTDASGRQHTKRFSVRKYGEEGAKQEAIGARKHAEHSLQVGEDPFFIPPSSPRAKLWRYMDFTKFMALLEESSLFFSKAENFEDPYEGAFSKSNRAHRSFVLSRSQTEDSLTVEHSSDRFAISCWYAAAHESAAMWNIYAKSTDAIAICTNYLRLRRALPSCIKIGLVKYADYNQQWISEQAPIHRFMYKRLSFNHENELRAIIDLTDPAAPINGNIEDGNFRVELDFNCLITNLYVSPKSRDWFHELVKKVCLRYKLHVQPVRSSLYDGPIL